MDKYNKIVFDLDQIEEEASPTAPSPNKTTKLALDSSECNKSLNNSSLCKISSDSKENRKPLFMLDPNLEQTYMDETLCAKDSTLPNKELSELKPQVEMNPTAPSSNKVDKIVLDSSESSKSLDNSPLCKISSDSKENRKPLFMLDPNLEQTYMDETLCAKDSTLPNKELSDRQINRKPIFMLDPNLEQTYMDETLFVKDSTLPNRELSDRQVEMNPTAPSPNKVDKIVLDSSESSKSLDNSPLCKISSDLKENQKSLFMLDPNLEQTYMDETLFPKDSTLLEGESHLNNSDLKRQFKKQTPTVQFPNKANKMILDSPGCNESLDNFNSPPCKIPCTSNENRKPVFMLDPNLEQTYMDETVFVRDSKSLEVDNNQLNEEILDLKRQLRASHFQRNEFESEKDKLQKNLFEKIEEFENFEFISMEEKLDLKNQIDFALTQKLNLEKRIDEMTKEFSFKTSEFEKNRELLNNENLKIKQEFALYQATSLAQKTDLEKRIEEMSNEFHFKTSEFEKNNGLLNDEILKLKREFSLNEEHFLAQKTDLENQLTSELAHKANLEKQIEEMTKEFSFKTSEFEKNRQLLNDEILTIKNEFVLYQQTSLAQKIELEKQLDQMSKELDFKTSEFEKNRKLLNDDVLKLKREFSLYEETSLAQKNDLENQLRSELAHKANLEKQIEEMTKEFSFKMSEFEKNSELLNDEILKIKNEFVLYQETSSAQKIELERQLISLNEKNTTNERELEKLRNTLIDESEEFDQIENSLKEENFKLRRELVKIKLDHKLISEAEACDELGTLV